MMEVKQKVIIFLEPMSKTLEALKESIEVNAKEDEFEIHIIESADEAGQLMQALAPVLLLSNDPKITAQYLLKNRQALKKNQSKTIIVSQKKIGQKSMSKLMKLQLTDYINEPIAPKTLLYKINMQIRALPSQGAPADYQMKNYVNQSQNEIKHGDSMFHDHQDQSSGDLKLQRGKETKDLFDDDEVEEQSGIDEQLERELLGAAKKMQNKKTSPFDNHGGGDHLANEVTEDYQDSESLGPNLEEDLGPELSAVQESPDLLSGGDFDGIFSAEELGKELEATQEAPKLGKELEATQEAPKLGKELKASQEAPELGKELEATQEAPKLGKELEATQEAPKLGKELKASQEAHGPGKELKSPELADGFFNPEEDKKELKAPDLGLEDNAKPLDAKAPELSIDFDDPNELPSQNKEEAQEDLYSENNKALKSPRAEDQTHSDLMGHKLLATSDDETDRELNQKIDKRLAEQAALIDEMEDFEGSIFDFDDFEDDYPELPTPNLSFDFEAYEETPELEKENGINASSHQELGVEPLLTEEDVLRDLQIVEAIKEKEKQLARKVADEWDFGEEKDQVAAISPRLLAVPSNVPHGPIEIPCEQKFSLIEIQTKAMQYLIEHQRIQCQKSFYPQQSFEYIGKALSFELITKTYFFHTNSKKKLILSYSTHHKLELDCVVEDIYKKNDAFWKDPSFESFENYFYYPVYEKHDKIGFVLVQLSKVINETQAKIVEMLMPSVKSSLIMQKKIEDKSKPNKNIIRRLIKWAS